MFNKIGLLSSLCLASSTLMATNGFYPHTTEGEPLFSVGLQAFYGDQSNNLPGWVEAGFATFNPGLFSPYRTQRKLGNSHNWGYEANFTYLFCNHLDDLRLSYSWIHNEVIDAYGLNGNLEYSPPAANTAPFGIGIRADTGNYSQQYNFDQVDLTLGTYKDITPCLHTRFGYGLSYANINQHGKATFNSIRSLTLLSIVTSGNSDIKSRFQGLGPQFIIDAQFDLPYCFSIVSNLGIAILYGINQTHSSVVNNELPTVSGGTLVSYYSDRIHKLAMGTQTKLGLKYQNKYNCDFSYSIEGGVRGNLYWNALQSGYGGLQSNGGYTDFSFHSDYSNYGIYFGANLNF